MRQFTRTPCSDPRRPAHPSEQAAEQVQTVDRREFPGSTPGPAGQADVQQPDTLLRAAGHDLRRSHTLRLLTTLFDSARRLLTFLAGTTSPVSCGMRRLQGRDRRLRVIETVQLGEKRFVALLRVDGEQFLIGGGTAGVSLLTAIAPAPAPAEPVQVGPPAAERSSPDERISPAAPASFPDLLTAERLRGELA